MKYDGVNQVSADNNNLKLSLNNFSYFDKGLSTYQETNLEKVEVINSYNIDENIVSYNIHHYDYSKPLVIDPLLFSTYYLSSQVIFDVKVDHNSDIITTSTYDVNAAYIEISKLSANGSILLYDTILDGNGIDAMSSAYQRTQDIVIDSRNNAIVIGPTASTDFPTTSNSYNNTSNGSTDTYIIRLNETGYLNYSSYFGGSSGDYGYALGIDQFDFIYLGVFTSSSDYPITVGAFNQTYGGNSDIGITKFSINTNQIIYSTFIGGSSYDVPTDIKVDSKNNTYVVGLTGSNDFTTTGDANITSCSNCGVVMFKLSSDGSNLLYSTYIGGSSGQSAFSLELDNFDNIYVEGTTYSSDFPVTDNAINKTYSGGSMVFITKFSSDYSILFSTLLGGDGFDYSLSMVVSPFGIYVFGKTSSSNFPVTSDAINQTYNGAEGFFLTKLSLNGSEILYSTFYGGSGSEMPKEVAIAKNFDIIIVGEESGTDFPVTANAYKSSSMPTFVVRFKIDTPDTTPPELNIQGNLILDYLSTGNTITWMPKDQYPYNYQVYLNNQQIDTGPWDNNTNIVINIDTSVITVLNYTIVVSDVFDQISTDTVLVTIQAIVPSSPINVAIGENYTHILINWTQPNFDGGDPVQGYHIHRSEDNITFNNIGTSTSTEFIDGNVVDGTTYYYYITAYNGVGDGTGSVIQSFSFTIPLPDAPQSLSGLANSSGIYLIWKAPLQTSGPKIQGYNVYRSTDGANFNLLNTTADLVYYDNNVESGNTYYYYVVAINMKGEGSHSNSINFEFNFSNSDNQTANSSNFTNTNNNSGNGSIAPYIIIGVLAVSLLGGGATVILRKQKGKKK